MKNRLEKREELRGEAGGTEELCGELQAAAWEPRGEWRELLEGLSAGACGAEMWNHHVGTA